MNIKKKTGFTLLETLVTLALFTFVMGSLYTIFLVGNKSWQTFSTNVVLQHEARQGLIVMTKEFRRAQNVLITKEEGGVQINFLRYPMGLVTYRWNSVGEDANKIIRTNNANVRVIAHNISSFSLDFLGNAIVIDLTASQSLPSGETSQFKLKEKVALRTKVYEDKQ